MAVATGDEAAILGKVVAVMRWMWRLGWAGEVRARLAGGAEPQAPSDTG